MYVKKILKISIYTHGGGGGSLCLGKMVFTLKGTSILPTIILLLPFSFPFKIN